MPLTENRDTLSRDGLEFGFIAASQVFLGAMVGLDATGQAVPATINSSIVGVAMNEAKSLEKVIVRRGVFCFENSAGAEALSCADINKPCYVADDCTVKKTAGSPAAPVAGVVMDIDDFGVWVKF